MHLAIIVRQKHAQFRGPGRTERNVVGLRLWPGVRAALGRAAARRDGRAVAARRAVQINPIWQWGPFEPYLATNGAQPDWYLGWLIGALRLMPGWELHIGSYTPSRTRSSAACSSRWRRSACSSSGRRSNGVAPGRPQHDLLDAPSDAPRRTAAICAATAVVGVVFLAGSADRIAVAVHISYVTQIWILRVAVFVLPVAVYYLVRGICFELQERGRVTPVEPGSSSSSRSSGRRAVDADQLAAERQRLPLAGGRERHDLVCRFGVVVHRVPVRVAVEETRAQHLGRRRDVHLRDPRGRQVAEDDALRDEVPLADQRDVVREQLAHDRRHQVEDGDAELVRLVAPLRAELRGERLLERVLRDERQAELVAEHRGRRRLARTGRPGDDD